MNFKCHEDSMKQRFTRSKYLIFIIGTPLCFGALVAKKIFMKLSLLLLLVFLNFSSIGQNSTIAVADPATYLNNLRIELQKEWPKNKTITIVFHGHSVPAGYFKTPQVNTLSAYPQLFLKKLKAVYPLAVVNVIVTAIGGENSMNWVNRFKKEVLTHKPDLFVIYFALNDRGAGLEKSYSAWNKMIKMAKSKGIKIILLTPSPDQSVNYQDPFNQLKMHSDQICRLAGENHIGLVDSYKLFEFLYQDKEELKRYMSQVNHPNELGHDLIASDLLTWFK